MKKYIILLFMLIQYYQAFAQKSLIIKDVAIPDSIGMQEIRSFNLGKSIVKGQRCPTYNLLYPNNYSYENGIYEYFLSGSPHTPIKIFIYYNSKTYFFTHDGFLEPCDFIREYSDCIAKLKINNSDAINYLKAISEFLRDEIKKTYGRYIKIDANNK